jgi:hypothetical protein
MLVRFGDRVARPRPHGNWGHAFLVANTNTRSTYEAKSHGIINGTYTDYAKQGAVFFTDDSWLPPVRKAVVDEAFALLRTPYDYLDILDRGFAELKAWIDHDVPATRAARLGLPKPFSYDQDIKVGARPRALICSVFVAYCWLAAAATDLRDGRALHKTTPGDLFRTALRDMAGPHDCNSHRAA